MILIRNKLCLPLVPPSKVKIDFIWISGGILCNKLLVYKIIGWESEHPGLRSEAFILYIGVALVLSLRVWKRIWVMIYSGELVNFLPRPSVLVWVQIPI